MAEGCLGGDELGDLGDDVDRDRLALANATHAVGALRVVAEGEVLAEREDCPRARALRDVDARRVDLVVKGEAALLGHVAPLEVHHHRAAATRAGGQRRLPRAAASPPTTHAAAVACTAAAGAVGRLLVVAVASPPVVGVGVGVSVVAAVAVAAAAVATPAVAVAAVAGAGAGAGTATALVGRTAPQEDLLLAIGCEEDDAVDMRELMQQGRGHLHVAHAHAERANVDERVRRRLERGDRRDEAADVPLGTERHSRDDGRVGERAQHLGVVAHLVDAVAHLERQQRRGRAREGDPPREEHLAADVLPVGRELHRLVREVLGEDELAQVVAHDGGAAHEELVELRQVGRVLQVEQVQRQHVVGPAPTRLLGLGRRRSGAALGLGRRGGGARCHHVLVGVRALAGSRAADVAARRLDPRDPQERGRPLELGAGLRLERRAQMGHHGAEVGLAHPLVAVGERRQADGDVRVRKLGGERWRVLADEGHREEAPRARHGARGRLHLCNLRRREEPEGDAAHLAQDVRQQVAQPVGAQVEQLGVPVRERRLHRLVRGAVLERLECLRVGDLDEALPPQPREEERGEEGAELLVVEGRRDEHEVRLALQEVLACPKRHRLLQLAEVRGLGGARAPEVGVAADAVVCATGAVVGGGQLVAQRGGGGGGGGRRRGRRCEDGVEEVGGHLPARRGEVEGVPIAERPVELRAQRVEHHVDLVDDSDGATPQLEELGGVARLREQLLPVDVEEAELRDGRAAAHAKHAAEALRQRALPVDGLAPRLCEVQQLEQLECEGLDRGGRRDHQRVLLDGRASLAQQGLARLRPSVEGERQHWLAQRGIGEARAQHGEGEGEQGGGHNLQDELAAVGEHQPKQRRDDGRLALAHQQLVADRAARARSTHKLADELYLRRSEHQARAVLVDEQPRVEDERRG